MQCSWRDPVTDNSVKRYESFYARNDRLHSALKRRSRELNPDCGVLLFLRLLSS